MNAACIEYGPDELKLLDETIARHIPSCVTVLDDGLLINFANRAFLKFVSLSWPEVIGEHVSIVLPFSLLRAEKLLLSIIETLEMGGSRTLRGIGYSLHGTSRSANLYLRGLRGERNRVMMIIEDTTETNKLRHQLAHSQRINSIGELAAGAAHDFNNLIGSIIGYSSLLRKTAERDSDEPRVIDMISSAAESAANLSRQLLDMSSSRETPLRVISPAQVVKNTKELLVRTFDRSITIETSISPLTARVMGNETQLRQALLNICLNARDAMPEGGTLRIAAGPVRRDDRPRPVRGHERGSNYVLIEVSDSGTGIEPRIAGKIFDPFFTTKGKGEGTGLGLTLARNIVKGMGGFVEVDSTPGAGTTFRIYIPAVIDTPDVKSG